MIYGLAMNESLSLTTDPALLLSHITHLQQQNQHFLVQLSWQSQQHSKLAQANEQLKSEVIERQKAESALRLLLDNAHREKNDLELLLEMTTVHSDSVEEWLYEKAIELAQDAKTDGLTQIANRREFDTRLGIEWHRALREESHIALILCDVDHFKAFNDTYGHPAGDACLRHVAKAINSVIRRPADLAARYGGEEFAIILPGTDAKGAIHVAQLMGQAVAQGQIPHANSSAAAFVTISLGVCAVQPLAGMDPLQLIEASDHGLYLAKHQGRNRSVYHHMV
jgi:diguanylate cyclase (GGDEF)-like protein